MHFLRRFKWARYCILQYYKRERPKWAAARWEYRRSVLSIIGQITVTWAGIEMVIDHLIAWYHPLHGAQEIQPALPVNFEKKMDYLNKMARDPGFDDGGHGLRSLRTEAKRLNNWRKTLLHGVVSHMHAYGLDWRVSVRNFKKPGAPMEHYRFNDADLREILSQMSKFSHAITPWVGKLTGLAPYANASSSSTSSEWPISN